MKQVVTGKYNEQDYELILDSKAKIGDMYWAEIADGRHCLVQKNLKIVSPPLDKELVGFFDSNDYKDLCLILKSNDESMPAYFHLKKNNDKYENVFSTKTEIDAFFKIIKSENDKYWFLETLDGEQALYDINKGIQLTPFFNKIEFVDSPVHLAFISKDINVYSDDEDDDHLYAISSLVGFIDYEGSFSSRLYDTEGNKYYYINKTGRQGILEFLTLYEHLSYLHKALSVQKEEEVDEIIQGLFEEMVERKHQNNEKCKIYKFEKREW